MYFVSLCCPVYCLCVNILLSPGVNPTADNKYIILVYHNIKYFKPTKFHLYQVHLPKFIFSFLMNKQLDTGWRVEKIIP